MVPQSNVLADTGSDHALLPIALVLNGKVTRAYASEVNEGPHEASLKNIEKYGVSNYVSAVLSNGISELEIDVKTVSICGMGGSLIVDILTISAGVLGVVSISVVGIKYMSAGGNEVKVKKTKLRIGMMRLIMRGFVGVLKESPL